MITVAEVGSVTRAAHLLQLVQPAVTRQIRALENELGVSLFERSRQGMTLTPAGEIMLIRARRALRELEQAAAEIRPLAGEIAGIVTVGVLESLVDLVPQRLSSLLRAKHPGIELRVLTGFSGYLHGWLDDGEIDLALLYNVADSPSLAITPLLTESLWAVGPPGSGLDPDSPIDWESVLAHPLVLPVAGHGLRSIIDLARAAIQLEPIIAFETNSMHLQKSLVLGGYGWTVLPASGVTADVACGAMCGAPLVSPEAMRSVVLGLPRARRTPAAAQVVASELVRLARDLVQSKVWPSATLVSSRSER